MPARTSTKTKARPKRPKVIDMGNATAFHIGLQDPCLLDEQGDGTVGQDGHNDYRCIYPILIRAFLMAGPPFDYVAFIALSQLLSHGLELDLG